MQKQKVDSKPQTTKMTNLESESLLIQAVEDIYAIFE